MLKGVKLLFDLRPKERPEELFGRGSELEEVLRLVRLGSWVVILGPRMVGKSSLLKVSRAVLEKQGYRALYLSLWGVRGFGEFLLALLDALNNARPLLEKLKEGLRGIRELEFGPSGLSVRIKKKPFTVTTQIFSVLGRYGGKTVIALDEVQELSAITPRFLKLLAYIFNTYPNMTFIFSGSMFGTIGTLLNPPSTSPLYGRPPAKIILKPFDRETSLRFLEKGFSELGVRMKIEELEEAVDELDGVVGWLTLYGNYVAVRRIPHREALDSTYMDGYKIVEDELEHFLEGRTNKELYLEALKVIATRARWSEIKRSLEIRLGRPVNDATIKNMLDSLQKAILIKKENKHYFVQDPILRRYLLQTRS